MVSGFSFTFDYCNRSWGSGAFGSDVTVHLLRRRLRRPPHRSHLVSSGRREQGVSRSQASEIKGGPKIKGFAGFVGLWGGALGSDLEPCLRVGNRGATSTQLQSRNPTQSLGVCWSAGVHAPAESTHYWGGRGSPVLAGPVHGLPRRAPGPVPTPPANPLQFGPISIKR